MARHTLLAAAAMAALSLAACQNRGAAPAPADPGAANAMKPLIIAAGKTAPTGRDERRKGLIGNLNAAAPANFDKVYQTQQEAAHNEAPTLMPG